MKSQELLARKTKTWKTTHQFIPIVITMIALVWIIVSAAEPIKASAISDKTVNITSGSQQIYWGTEPGYSFSYYPASVFSNSATTPPTYSYTGKNYIFTVNAHTGKNQRRGQIYAWKNGKLAGTLTVVQAGHTHSYNKGWQTRKEPTCGTTGIKYRICSICRYEETKTIAATGNHYCRSGWITDKAKGCFTDGKRHQVCSVCLKNVNYVTLPAYGCHNWGKWSIQEATCTKVGWKRRTCSRCGGKEEQSLSASGHDWSNWTIVSNATCSQEGTQSRMCSICDSTEYKTIPKLIDSDGDGIPDTLDKSPKTKFDKNFRTINDSKLYGVGNLIHSKTRADILKGESLWNTADDSVAAWAAEEAAVFAEFVGTTPLISLFASLKGGIEGAGSITLGSTPTAVVFLDHYLSNGATDVEIPLEVPIGVTRAQRNQYYKNMNALFEVAESSVLPNNLYSFATTINTDGKWVVNFHNPGALTGKIGYDWWLSIGQARNALTAKISSTIDSQGKTHYHAIVNYYLIDYYDWTPNDERALYNMHVAGRAKFFKVYGEYTVVLDWVEGSRYPEPLNYTDIVLEDTKFQGIDDNGKMAQTYYNAKRYYNELYWSPSNIYKYVKGVEPDFPF